MSHHRTAQTGDAWHWLRPSRVAPIRCSYFTAWGGHPPTSAHCLDSGPMCSIRPAAAPALASQGICLLAFSGGWAGESASTSCPGLLGPCFGTVHCFDRCAPPSPADSSALNYRHARIPTSTITLPQHSSGMNQGALSYSTICANGAIASGQSH